MNINGNVEEKDTIHGKLTQLPTVDKTLSISGSSADAKVTGDALMKKVNVSDIVNNCDTDINTRPLSASQGVKLQRQIDELKTLLNS
jgi:hypothetical protein